MPADERATLTARQVADRIYGLCDENAVGLWLRDMVERELEKALKEADRLAREDAKLRYAKYLGPMDRAECDRIIRHPLYKLGDALLVWVNEGDLIAHGVDTAIRASITTDEG